MVTDTHTLRMYLCTAGPGRGQEAIIAGVVEQSWLLSLAEGRLQWRGDRRRHRGKLRGNDCFSLGPAFVLVPPRMGVMHLLCALSAPLYMLYDLFATHGFDLLIYQAHQHWPGGQNPARHRPHRRDQRPVCTTTRRKACRHKHSPMKEWCYQ
jgi:hypothetical protein